MISLKTYTKERLLEDVKHRFEKIANMLDDGDFEDYLGEAISYLSESMYSPRSMIFTPNDFTSYQDKDAFIDVTDLKIDVINRVYFGDQQFNQNFFFEELGLMPFIAQSSGLVTTITSVTNFMNTQSNFNMMNRQMRLIDDFELLPITADGRQLLQLRNKGLTWVEFLPSLDYSDDEWNLFDHEYQMVKKLTFALLNLANAEMQISAVTLGVGSEAQSLVSYWKSKIDDIKKDWQEHHKITALY